MIRSLVCAALLAGPFVFPSGVTVYRMTDGVVDDGTFVPLERPSAPRR